MAAKASPKSSRKEPAAPPARSSKRKLAAAAPAADPPVKQLTLEERVAKLEERLLAAGPVVQQAYRDSLDMSWIYHDSALEGVVYTFDELRTGLSGQAPPVTDSSLQPACDDIRRHKEAIEFVRDFATKKRLPITLDVI